MSDPCSFSAPSECECTHINWFVNVLFEKHILDCRAELEFEVKKNNIKELVLDTRDLTISQVTNDTGEILKHSLGDEHKAFGKPLNVELPKGLKSGCKLLIKISYQTSSSASAAQWLTPEQTAGKKYPYFFTQCQAIHARSIIPCQDTPSVKTPYNAEVTVPKDLVALMSAVGTGSSVHPQNPALMVFTFTQKVVIPIYLIALVVGPLVSQQVGPRSKVWTEKEMLEISAWEFAEVESQLAVAEKITFPYVWRTYDLLILPPSFPYGGMENPCLTFVTPTLLVGEGIHDVQRSSSFAARQRMSDVDERCCSVGGRPLTVVVAHEISHSWTGNLVTNRTWEHFWLNEGFTVFLERKILGRRKGEKMRDFAFIGGWKTLKDSDICPAKSPFWPDKTKMWSDSIKGALHLLNKNCAWQARDSQLKQFPDNSPLTQLVVDLKDLDPDDAFSSVPYEKGSCFLYYLERILGGPEVFEPFLRKYLEKFQHQTVTTHEWKEYLEEYFHDKKDVLKQVDWNSWLYTPGMPPVNVIDWYDTTLTAPCTSLCDRWLKASEADLDSFLGDDIKNFTPPQVVEFLAQVVDKTTTGKPLAITHLKRMDEVYDLTPSRNSEVKFRWLRLCARSAYQDRYPEIVQFITIQGRMKFIRPLYKELYAREESKDLAVKTFEEHRDFYHPIAAAQVAKDLNLE